MRPRRLELAGFAAFGEPTVVDFGDAEVFVLTGPTGAGKSSLIDAMVFALYGSVPRYADKRAVAPAIALGRLEARVRLDFSIGETLWTVVRVVRRNRSGGASTDEARLEGEGEVVAGTADEVTEAVTRLLGLRYEHFTKSVVLPQGEFARFLHDKPGDRQALLRSLLDVEIYGRVRELASREAGAASERMRILESRLGDLAWASSEARTRAERNVALLEDLSERIETGEALIDEHLATLERAEDSARQARAWLDALGRLEAPADAAMLVEAARELRNRVNAAEATVEAAAAAAREAEARETAMPESGPLLETKVTWASLIQARESEGALIIELRDVTSHVEDRTAALDRAHADLEERRARLEAITRTHAAHDLAMRLERGASCPVCGQIVTVLPQTETPDHLASASEGLLQAEAEHRQRADLLAEARSQLARIEGRHGDVQERIEELSRRLEARPALESIETSLASIAEAEAEHTNARSDLDRAHRHLAQTRLELEGIEASIETLRRSFDRARDSLAALDPPLPERRDPALDWEQLSSWAANRRASLVREAAQAEEEAERERSAASRVAQELDDLLASRRIAPEGQVGRSKVVFEVLNASRHELSRIIEATAESERIASDLSVNAARRAVAEMLQLHLRSDHFEAWLLDEALDALTAGANALLRELSEGAYSLGLAGRGFHITDHRNADETRSVRTLSGGETFLVSLSLALSLAEQLAALSVQGGARMETIFLDEGFGSLDRETLEVVGSVIHELGAQGRTVGLVTHVAELAEQVPVRFEVRRGPRSATVTRVET